MKSRMIKLVSTRSVPAFVLATTLLLLLGTAVATEPAMDPVSGTGSSEIITANPYVPLPPLPEPFPEPPEGVMMQFEGSVELSVRGELKTADLLVNVYIVLENEEGVQHVSASHILTFEDGSTIKTDDMEVAEPTDTLGLYTINATMEVKEGTGIYDGVSGHLTAHGTMAFNVWPYKASFTLRGVISSATE
jgi:hypothetical protein